MTAARVAAAVAILAAVAFAAGCNETGARPGVLATAADTADQTLIKVRHYITRDGVQKSLVEADTAYYYEASQSFELRVVTVTFYDADGAPTSTLTSNEGTYQTMTGAMAGPRQRRGPLDGRDAHAAEPGAQLRPGRRTRSPPTSPTPTTRVATTSRGPASRPTRISSG